MGGAIPTNAILPPQVFDYESNGSHRLLGEAESSALKLQKLAGGALLLCG